MAVPSLVAQDRTIHVIYAGDETTHREHRYSRDAGQTWSPVTAIFGDLHGQAEGDGLAVDALGRVHYVGQIRYPQGLYHAFWDDGRWSRPNLFYQIDLDSTDPLAGQIHAHSVRLAVRAGHQLVTTFYHRSEPVLYAMHSTLSGVPAVRLQSTPQPEPPEPTRVPVQPIPTVTSGFLNERNPSRQNEMSAPQGPGYAVWFSLGSTLLLLVIVIVMKRRDGVK
jgi:hypothetical protein